MEIISKEIRCIDEIKYTLERKNIKNINLRIRNDGNVFVSASPKVPLNIIEKFILSKKSYILSAAETFRQNQTEKTEMQYISGENVTLLGKNLRLKIEKDNAEYVESDGVYVYIHVKCPDYYNRKKNLFLDWTDKQCNLIFSEIMKKVHTRFIAYNVEFPELKLRNMISRWGSCQPDKGIITLNRRLIEAPKCCIEYVVYHEFCHFVHPNHSKDFYSLLQVMMPEWKENKSILEKSVLIKN